MPQDIGSRACRVTSNPGRRRHANRLSGPDISAKYSACTLSAFAGGRGRIADLTWPKSKRISCHMNCSSPIFPFQRITTSPNTEPSRPGRRPRVSSPALHIQSSASPRPACKTGPGAPWCHLRRCRLHHQLQRKPPPTLTLTRHMAPRYPPAPVRVSPGRFSTQQPQQAFKNMNDISEPPSPIPTCGMPSAFAAARATPRGPEAPTPPA